MEEKILILVKRMRNAGLFGINGFEEMAKFLLETGLVTEETMFPQADDEESL